MKLIILFFICFYTLAGEVTGAGKRVEEVLLKSNLSTQKLKDMGLKLGEVTGAGKIHVDSLEMIVTTTSVISMNEVIHTHFKHPSAGQVVLEVERFDTTLGVLKKSQILAFITR